MSVDIFRNGARIATVSAEEFRRDLLAAEVSDGRAAFSFNPLESLEEGENKIEVRFQDTSALISNGSHSIWFDSTKLRNLGPAEPMSRSKERWQGVEPDVGLTWGTYMTGDTFFDKVGEFIGGSIEPSYRKILEIGPGYGRLLQTILERGYPYETYVGLELSEERVCRLGKKTATATLISFMATR